MPMLAAIAPSIAAVAPGSQFSYNHWNGVALTDDKTGKFTGCLVGSTYANGTTLGFYVGSAGYVTIGLTRRDWNFTPGQKIHIEMRIDQRYSVRTVAVAFSTDALRVELPA